MRTEALVHRVAAADLPTDYGDFRVIAFESGLDKETHIALVKGQIGDGKDVMVRVHSRCLTGDVFHSLRCDCGPQRDAAMARIEHEGRGVFLLKLPLRPLDSRQGKVWICDRAAQSREMFRARKDAAF